MLEYVHKPYNQVFFQLTGIFGNFFVGGRISSGPARRDDTCKAILLKSPYRKCRNSIFGQIILKLLQSRTVSLKTRFQFSKLSMQSVELETVRGFGDKLTK